MTAPGDSEEAFRQRFLRRRLIASIVIAVAGLLTLLRYPALAEKLPSGLAWLEHAWFWSPFLVVAMLVWAWRCTVCGGGIRLDGKTCASCGRVFAARP